MFLEQVVPLLEDRCFSCHSSAVKKGGFSFSNREALHDSGFVDLDDPDASYLLELVTPQNGSAQMPKDARPFNDDEVALLRAWIAAGIPWPDDVELSLPAVTERDWWSLEPIKNAPPPASAAIHPVDAFIEQKLMEQGLHPVAQADPLTLIRRVTYDLTGLPPTADEVQQFLAACKVNPDHAWENIVDRLLGSPAFGEKWGQHWLDIARYAESHGYDKDQPRQNAWPYRDYVIRSLNEDKPYTRFVQEQIAGDVLFPGEPDGVVGLGFLAAGPWDLIAHKEVGEGKLDGRIAKHLDRDEMVSTVFNVFQSTTVQCAQCHHHKFDPIRMEDYYRLHAVFSAIDRADRAYEGLSTEQEQHKLELQVQLNELRKDQQKLEAPYKEQVAASTSAINRRIAELKEKYGSGLKPQYGYHSQISQRQDDEKWVQVDLGQSRTGTEIRIMPAFDQFNGIGAGFGFPRRYRVAVSDNPEFQKDVRILKDGTSADQENPGTSTIVINGDGNRFRYLRVTATKLRERKNDYIFALGELEILSSSGEENYALGAKVTARDSIESGDRWSKANLVDGIYFSELTNDKAMQELRELQDKQIAIENKLKPVGMDERLADIKSAQNKLTRKLEEFPQGKLVYAAATHFEHKGRFVPTMGKPRPIHLLHRGDLRAPGDQMTPGAPMLWEGASANFFHDDTWSEGEARAALAKYLTDPRNPLLWRSITNRLWGWTFGKPLVGTPNDFGRGGLQSAHPELLDYLGAKLRDDPRHSLKAIIRLLVTSDAYQRSSQVEASAARKDAGNAYCWRANRRRLTAEEFRDSLLLASGLLNRKMGGPSFKDFVVEHPQHSPHYEYHLHHPDDPRSHRRTIYRFVVRSQPQPFLTTLDCADPSISTPRRDESTTALQALAAWNNQLVAYCSEQLGEQLADQGLSPDLQVQDAARRILCREPLPAESAILIRHLEEHGSASLARVLFNMNSFLYLD
ncbi:DUF1549 domain-containing protein [Calycomorphotria hydatis]|uniref:DUF1549 domain-containing protein n=1 Tax=Calycomorphotria hydatis TaxID=2528027 RepID=UPI0018D21DEA|nr:DUF1549 domain-containing protein [Calycomorphotria hydatis]